MQFSISMAPTVLSFDQATSRSLGKAVWEAYLQLTRDKFYTLLVDLDADAPGFGKAIAGSGVLEDHRFVLAPEASHMVHHAEEGQEELIREVLYKSMLAEVARNSRKIVEYPSLWSISGDFFISESADGGGPFVYEAPRVNGLIPIDFVSPYCSYMNHEELGEDAESGMANYPMEDCGEIVERLEAALAPLSGSFPEIEAFLTQFTFHLVAKSNPGEDFTSGSNGFYIGRTVLANVELASPELLVEALVHEAAHGYLYMLEELSPWMADRERSIELGRNVLSCWTGNAISLRSFCQAVFIWYSLHRFWKGAENRDLYDADFVRARLHFIQAGFEKLDLDQIQGLAEGTIPPATMEVFRSIQTEISQQITVQS